MGPSYHFQFVADMVSEIFRNASGKTLHVDELTDAETARLSYYCKLSVIDEKKLPKQSKPPFWKKTAYSYDFYRCLNHCPDKISRYNYKFGDVTAVPDHPAFVKSRPINDQNQNSVILPLEMVRHFQFPMDKQPFVKKLDKAVWRGACYQPWRQRFMEIAKTLPHLVDAGDTARKSTNPKYPGAFLTIEDQRKYKIIISLQGNDVASNLKWALHSNSIVIMPKPTMETWFCEGFLEEGTHYGAVSESYSDLAEVIEYYLDDTEACWKIIRNAHEYTNQFQDQGRQYMLGGLVLARYKSLLTDTPTIPTGF